MTLYCIKFLMFTKNNNIKLNREIDRKNNINFFFVILFFKMQKDKKQNNDAFIKLRGLW